MAKNNDDVRRREFLKWASAVGLTSIAPNTVSAIAHENRADSPSKTPPGAARANRFEDVTLTHVLEHDHVRERVSSATENDRPEAKFGAGLRAELDGDTDEYDVFVRTVGERSTVTTERYGRTIEGWAPSKAEVRRLGRFGDVVYASEFISTTVSIRGVEANALRELASLPFVVSVGYEEPAPYHDEHSRVAVEEEVYVHKDDIRGDDLLGFETIEAEYDIDERVRVGVIDSGYGDPTNWGGDHARQYIDESLADGFNEDWDHDHSYDHGAAVANTLAYALQDGWEDFIVPLKRPSTDSRGGRKAIEYACAHDIEVINMSFGGTKDFCRSLYCAELKSYADMGYIPVGTTGNHAFDQYAAEPAISQFCVSVGGVVDGPCPSGDGNKYSREYEYEGRRGDVTTGSNYADILYDHEECPFCAEENDSFVEFNPDVYSIWGVKTNYEPTGVGDSYYPGGTSNAAPEVAAAAVVMQSHGLYDFQAARDIFRGMDYAEICPAASAQAGSLLHMPDVVDELADLTPRQPRKVPNLEVAWVTDDAARVEWRPSTAWGDKEIDYYKIYLEKGAFLHDQYQVPGEQTFLEVTGLDADTEYEAVVFAWDDGNVPSPASSVPFETDDSA